MLHFLFRAFGYAIIGSILAGIALAVLKLVSEIYLMILSMGGGERSLILWLEGLSILGGIVYAGIQTWREHH